LKRRRSPRRKRRRRSPRKNPTRTWALVSSIKRPETPALLCLVARGLRCNKVLASLPISAHLLLSLQITPMATPSLPFQVFLYLSRLLLPVFVVLQVASMAYKGFRLPFPDTATYV